MRTVLEKEDSKEEAYIIDMRKVYDFSDEWWLQNKRYWIFVMSG